jgi:hypothetical protein
MSRTKRLGTDSSKIEMSTGAGRVEGRACFKKVGRLIAIAFAVAGSYAAEPLDDWVQRVSPTANTLSVVTYGNGLYVAVGVSGTIITSLDGASWSRQSSGTTIDIYGVTYGGNQFVAVGGNGLVLTSPNGTNWTSRPTGVTAGIYTVAYGNGRYVAVGDVILTSLDGTSWSSQNVASATAQMSVMGEDGAWFPPIIFPPPVSFTTHSLSGVTFTAGRFVAVGFVATTTSDFFFGWITTYRPKVLSSQNGVTWTAHSAAGDFGLNDIAFGNAQFITVGSGGAVLGSGNGSDWSARTRPSGGGLNSVAFAEGAFVAVGESGGIFTSANGSSWTTRNSPTTKTIYEVTFGKDSFVAVGQDGTILQSGKFVQELQYQRAGDQLTISWNSPDYLLQQNDEIDDAAGWTATPGGDVSPVQIKMEHAAMIFRLLRK